MCEEYLKVSETLEQMWGENSSSRTRQRRKVVVGLQRPDRDLRDITQEN